MMKVDEVETDQMGELYCTFSTIGWDWLFWLYAMEVQEAARVLVAQVEEECGLGAC